MKLEILLIIQVCVVVFIFPTAIQSGKSVFYKVVTLFYNFSLQSLLAGTKATVNRKCKLKCFWCGRSFDWNPSQNLKSLRSIPIISLLYFRKRLLVSFHHERYRQLLFLIEEIFFVLKASSNIQVSYTLFTMGTNHRNALLCQ